MSPAIIILCVICATLALGMLFSKNPITSALCLLGVLIMTAGIYGLIGEHMVATIQLVVYAGAIMVLFIFSIMLLNLNTSEQESDTKPVIFYPTLAAGAAVFGVLVYSFNKHFSSFNEMKAMGPFTPEAIAQMGGNAKVIAHGLFTQFYISFEVVSLALLVGVVGAVVLAKRKID
jgi:NADH-quinone oxidoreductase subunit J